MLYTLEIAVAPALADNVQHIASVALSQLKLSAADKAAAQVIVRHRSLDARGKNPLARLRVEVYVAEPVPAVQPILQRFPVTVKSRKRVIIVGAGPAGYFAALQLIEMGFCPIVLERGKDVQARRRDLRAIQQEGVVNPDSNYCFGEGGAGTYSDGKLYTRSHKRGDIDRILRLLVEHGAHSDILIEAHPHIGSNKLPKIVEAMRQTIERFGGEVHFESRVTDFLMEGQRMLGVVTNQQTEQRGEAVILATGHSARDIFRLLHQHQIQIEAKPFALGVRIEHPQALIDSLQYRCPLPRPDYLPAASYSLVEQVNGRGVFSFCMCPGGLIVPAATDAGEIVVNGMSMSRRDSPYANSGMVVAVEMQDLRDFEREGVFMAMAFQQSVEQAMFRAGDGSQRAPAQRMTDFVKGKLSVSLPGTSYIPGVFSARLDQLLPPYISQRLQQGLLQMGKKKKGYFTEEAQVVGTESRTSSPVRVPRDASTLMHPQVLGLFPCGEGAGYAGGIVSAAMDGERVAKAVQAWLGA